MAASLPRPGELEPFPVAKMFYLQGENDLLGRGVSGSLLTEVRHAGAEDCGGSGALLHYLFYFFYCAGDCVVGRALRSSVRPAERR